MLIRNVAIQNLTTNDNSIYNKMPLILFKFNDYSLQNSLKGTFSFDCNRWFLYDWKNNEDANFIGTRDGSSNMSGMMRNILKTNYMEDG